MNKTFKLYGIIFIIVMVLLVLLEMSKADVVDWRKTYQTDKKSPFGLFIFNQEIDKLLNNQLTRVESSPYNYYQSEKKYAPHNILFIAKNIDPESWKKVLNMVEEGSDVLVITDEHLDFILDSTKIEFRNINSEDINILKLSDQQFKNDSLIIDKFPNRSGFRYIDSADQMLGSAYTVGLAGANFIKINKGKGHIYYHTEPLFLTNYYLLKPNSDKYLQDVFSYLPERKTIWFSTGKSLQKSGGSPLSFILANPSLKYAWYLLLAGLIIFIFFQAKRKQRIIPIVKPLENKSVEFVKSIGNLYLQEGDFHDMMAKKAQYFLHKVRLEFYLDTKTLDTDFAKKLQLKTGKPLDKIEEAITLLKNAQHPYASVQKDDLIKMNKILDDILK